MKTRLILLCWLTGFGATFGTTLFNINQDKQPQVYVQQYDLAPYHSKVESYEWLIFIPARSERILEDLQMHWTIGVGGHLEDHFTMGYGYFTNTIPSSTDIVWPADSWPPTLDGTQIDSGWQTGTNSVLPPYLPMEQCDIKGTGYFYNLGAGGFAGAEYNRTASTIVKLFTGGKSLSRRVNLHALSVSLFEQAFTWWFDGSSGGRSVNVADIAPGATAGVFGTVGNDGMAYKLLEDGRDVVITPIKDGVPHQRGDHLPVDTKHKLSIDANGAPCNLDGLSTKPVFIVGQYVTFTSTWDQTPPNIQSQTNKWQFDGHFFNDGTNAVPGVSWPTCSTNYFVNFNMLTNDPTTAWWVSGGFDFAASYPVTLDKGLTFSNGQHVVVNENGSFKMYRPLGKITTTTGAVARDSTIHYGTSDPGAQGIVFSNTVTMPSLFSGYPDTEYVQVFYSDLERHQLTSGLWYRRQAADVLDTQDPYGIDFAICDTCTSDSPSSDGISNDKAVSISESVGTWLMFRPPGGQRVPLRKVDWNWSGDATLSGGTWTFTHTNTVNPSDYETETYPTWTNNINNFSQHPE